MGLAGPRKRTKLSQDPNNTNWSRSTTNFGHKILTSQGWKPGDYLGAKDANHASHYSAANASHIRVLLKDDNLGLGAKRGSDNAETFGLSQFSGLLGRLNGKSEDVLKKETEARRDVELRLWQGRKHGVMNFVSAGFLVGDKIEDRPRVKSAKEMRSNMGVAEPDSKPDNTPVTQMAVEVDRAAKSSDKKSKKSKDPSKKRKRSSDDNDDEPTTATTTTTTHADAAVPPAATKEQDKEKESKSSDRKAAKAARKLARQQRREAKAAKKAAKQSKTSTKTAPQPQSSSKPELSSSDSGSDSDETEPSTTTTATTSAVASAPTSGTSTPTAGASGLGSIPRHAVRQRYIASKRMAGMDPRALKEIFMIKT